MAHRSQSADEKMAAITRQAEKAKGMLLKSDRDAARRYGFKVQVSMFRIFSIP
jgi:hypothetical protein